MNPYLGFQCGIDIDGELWFSCFRGNGLFRYNGNTVEYMGSFREKGVKLFNDVVRYKDKLFFVPLAANNIHIYDLASGGMESISYKNPGIGDFVFAIFHECHIYMFPSFHPGILKLNPETSDVDIIDDWINEDFAKCRLSDEPFFRGDYVREGDVIYAPFCNAHAVLEFHLNDGSSTVHDVGAQGHATIASDGKRFWLGPRKGGGILCWNPAAGESTEHTDFPEGFKEGAFLGSLYRDGYVWMFPESANMVLKVDVDTGKLEEEELFSDICRHKWSAYSVWKAVFVYMRQEAEQILLCSGKSSETVIFRPEKKEIRRFRLLRPIGAAEVYQEEPDERYLAFRERRKERRKEKRYFHECTDYGIEEFIEDIEKKGMRTEAENSLDCGRSIYRCIVSDFKEYR